MREILNLRQTKTGYLINGYIEATATDEDVMQWIADGKEVMPQLTDEEVAEIEKNNHNTPILAQISEIEKEQQPRAVRESYSADDVIREQAIRYIKKYYDQITELRSQLI